MQIKVTLTAYEQLLDAAVRLKYQYEAYDTRIRHVICVFWDIASVVKISRTSPEADPRFTYYLQRPSEKVYRALSEMIRHLKRRYDRVYSFMDGKPIILSPEETENWVTEMGPEAFGQRVDVRNKTAVIKLCNQMREELKDANARLNVVYRQFEDVFEQVKGELIP